MIFEQQEDGSTIIQGYSQSDLRMSMLLNNLIKKQAAKKSEEWYESLTSYLDSML